MFGGVFMKNFFIIFFVSLFICPALFSQGQNEFKYTKEMLKTDAMSAASEYEKLSLQEQQKTVPMCIFGKRYWNSTEANTC